MRVTGYMYNTRWAWVDEQWGDLYGTRKSEGIKKRVW